MSAPPPGRRILFAPAAGPGVGGGHVMRCLTLAGALKDRGAACAFAMTADGAALAGRFGRGAFPIYRASVSEVLAAEAFETLVVDDYDVCAEQERPIRAGVRSLMVIDDLADREHLADLLLDPGYGRVGADYDGLSPDHAVRLTGPDFALVRPAFAAARERALARPLATSPRRLFISFGLSDVDGIAARATTMIRARFPKLEIDIALASTAPSAAALQARAAVDPMLHPHIDAYNIADLMARADAAIGAGGASTWERCCLGLPTLAVVVADNQRTTIQGMAADGALLAVDLHRPDFDAAFVEALDALWRIETRQRLRERSAGLCDGLGAARVADAILAL